MISYKKLWIRLAERGLSKGDLREQSGISTNILAKLGRDEPVSLDSLEKICNFLDCNIGDIMDFIRTEEEK